MNFRFPLLAFAFAATAASLPAQITTWTNGANDSSWSSAGNWSNGIPSGTSAVVIGTQPTGGEIGVDTGGPTNVASFQFASSLTAPVEVLPFSTETLTVAGAITNSDDNAHLFSIQVNAGGNATYAGGAGLTFTTLNVQNFTIGTTGSVAVTDQLVFNLTSAASYGSIGPIDADGAFISIASTGYTGSYGDVFNFSLGGSGFTGATLDMTLPTLSSGLSWNTANFLSQGTLTVVPEPSTWALLGVAALGAAGLFRRSRPVPARARPRSGRSAAERLRQPGGNRYGAGFAGGMKRRVFSFVRNASRSCVNP